MSTVTVTATQTVVLQQDAPNSTTAEVNAAVASLVQNLATNSAPVDWSTLVVSVAEAAV